jgi:hypothetical protein
VATDLQGPEGIALRKCGNRLLVVERDTESLKEVHLKSGEVKTIATELGFHDYFPGFPPDYIPWTLTKIDVAVDNGTIYVTADEANVIYRIKTGDHNDDDDCDDNGD